MQKYFITGKGIDGMRKVVAEKLTRDAFAQFGSFYDFSEPDGYPMVGTAEKFYPDRLVEFINGKAGFSGITVKKVDRIVIEKIEYHTTSSEIMMPLNDDMVFHVAPITNGKVVPELTHAFIVPKNTLIKFNAGVWHMCPFPVHVDELKALIVLPAGIYMNDCRVVELSEDKKFEIIIP